MQTHFKSYLLTCVAAVLILASCTKANKEGKFIPKDAPFVMHINGKSLSEKLPWDEIKQSPLFKEAYADTTLPAFGKKILDNPENSGIDVKSDIIVFIAKDSLGGYACIQGNIKDAAKFDAFNKDIIKNGSKSEEEEIKYISKSPVIIGWNKDKFVYIVDIPKFKAYGYDGGSKQTAPRDIMATCKAVFSLKEDNSLAKDEKFSELMKKQGDVHFWINGESFYSEISNIPGVGSLINMSKLYSGARTTATVNFENGKIALDIKQYASKELSKIYKKYQGSGINEDMIKRIAAKNVAAVFAINFKPEALKEIVDLTGFGEILNMGMSYVGFNISDFVKANKGDVVFAVTDITEKARSYPSYLDTTETIKDTTLQPDVIFAASIADKNAFNLIINGMKKLSDKSGSDDFSKSVHYNTNDKYFVIGNNKDNVDKYLTGVNADFDFLKKLKGYPIAGYVDIQYIMQKFEYMTTKDSIAKAIYDLSLKMWDNAYLMGGKYDNGGIAQQFEINLMDKNTNSLKQLNNYAAAIAALENERQKKLNEQLDDMQTEPTDSINK